MTPTSPRSAIGVGCRRGSKAEAIENLVRHALALAPRPRPHALYTVADKASEPGLAEAARRLRLDLVFLSRDTLRGHETRLSTRSIHAERQFGVPSVAEAAALAGAGPDAVLIVRRLARDGVTCAIAGHDAGCRSDGHNAICAVLGDRITGPTAKDGVVGGFSSERLSSPTGDRGVIGASYDAITRAGTGEPQGTP